MHQTLKNKKRRVSDKSHDQNDVNIRNRASRTKIALDADGEAKDYRGGQSPDKIRGWREGGVAINRKLYLKFFKSRLGKDWAEIHKEVCTNTPEHDIRTEAFNLVKTETFLDKNSEIWFYDYGMEPTRLADSPDTLYIHPVSRVLCYKKANGKSRTEYIHKARGLLRKEGIYMRQENLWFFVPLEKVYYRLEDNIYKERTLKKLEALGFKLNHGSRPSIIGNHVHTVDTFQGHDGRLDVVIPDNAKRQLNSKEQALFLKANPKVDAYLENLKSPAKRR